MSNVYSYNLLSAPWIPTVRCAETTETKLYNVGISEALRTAPEIQSISHTVPFIEFGIYRILITIVLDAYIVNGQRPTIGKMRAMLENGAFDQSIINKYLSDYEASFDLWDTKVPFLQMMSDDNRGEKKPIMSMFPAIPSGVNVLHWYHYFEKEITVSEKIAAQLLTTISPFNFKTKPGEVRTLAGDPPMYTLVMGKNLFETIVFNVPRPNGRISFKQELNNGPAWRTKPDLSKLPKRPTIAQGFTWPVRAIRLEHQGAVVANAVNHTTYKKPTDKAKEANVENLYDAKYGWRDPNVGVVTSSDSITHIKAQQYPTIWRDAVPLFLIASEGNPLCAQTRRSRPEVITNALRLFDTAQFKVAVYGMRKKAGGGGDVKVEEWFRSILTLPTEVARDSRLSYRAVNAFKITQDVADALQIALRMLRATTEARKNALKEIRRDEGNALMAFWQSLEITLGYRYLDALEQNAPDAEENLRDEIWRQGRKAFTRAISSHRRTADGLFRIANASNWFNRRLAKLLPKSTQQQSEENV